MIKKLVLGGIVGIVIGAAIGLFVLNSKTGAIGIACSMAASICGVLLAIAADDEDEFE